MQTQTPNTQTSTPPVAFDSSAADRAVMGGAPQHGDAIPQSDPAPANPNVHQAGGANLTQPVKKLETLGRKFEREEDLIEYTKDLERQNIETQMALNKVKANPGQPAPTLQNPSGNTVKAPDGPGLDQIMFTNPTQFVQRVKEEAKQEMRAENQAKESEKKFWSDFFQEHPDLQSANPVVQSITREKWGEIAKLPLAEAKKIIATQSRKVVEMIRGTSGVTTDLPRTTASALPASSGNTPPAQTVVQDEPENFMAELKKLRQRRKKA